jgi:ADP-ribose pyrophosphatase
MGHSIVTALEIVEDFTASGRCDEGFLHVRRLRVRNRREDGSTSEVYRVDVIDRPKLDAVAVLVWRRTPGGVEFLTRENLRPAAFFRSGKHAVVPDGRSHLYCEEIVAGLLEAEDEGEVGLRHRAAQEVREEAGLSVEASAIELLGSPFFVAPGILSEKIFLAAVEVTNLTQEPPEGDGSPLEETGAIRWRPESSVREAIEKGLIQDAKTELALTRFLARHPELETSVSSVGV